MVKSYVENSAVSDLDFKQSVRVATTGGIVLSGLQTVDQVSLLNGDRVLVKDQAEASQNGIYIALAGAWNRSLDANINSEVSSGMILFVEEGFSNVRSIWILSTNDPISIGTTPLSFTKFIGAQGTQGQQGAQGIQGIQGTAGSQGTIGNTGSQGITGNAGSQGTVGNTGSQGITGNNGSQGTTGSQGMTGSQGTSGYQGSDGTQGIQGIQGTRGASASGTALIGNGSGTTITYSLSEALNIVGSGSTSVSYNDSSNTVTVSTPSSFRSYELVNTTKSVFTVDTGYSVNNIDVYHNGIKLINSQDFTATNGTTFTLVNSAISGDVVEWSGFASVPKINLSLGEVRSDYVGTNNYIGIASAGSSESSGVWRIKRNAIGSDGVTIITTTATNVSWADRLTASYS
ncbi:MAG: hypothetical protein WCO97_05220 [bacterium]